jgi:hypothetical protein
MPLLLILILDIIDIISRHYIDAIDYYYISHITLIIRHIAIIDAIDIDYYAIIDYYYY